MNRMRWITAVCIILVTSLLLFGGEDANEVTFEKKQVKAALILCKNMIDDGLYKSIKRRAALALDQGCEYLIFEIQTYGGLVKSADDISKFLILDLGKKVHTIAYVTTEAISAGAMISVSCKDIIMIENTTIGDCAPILMGQPLEGVEREKAESFIRATFKRAAQANDYPEALLKAMVTVTIKVYGVTNLETGELEFFEDDRLPNDPNKYDLANKQLLIDDDELLTWTSQEAEQYGISRATVSDIDGLLEFISERDNVEFVSEPILFKTLWSEEMVRFVNSPAVMGALVMIAMLGVYIELNTPGLGLPGLAALICFVIIISSKYLTGMANWVEVAIFVVGLLLLAIEVFVLPGFGIAGTLGAIFIIAGLFGMLVKNPPEKFPWPEGVWDWHLFTNGLLGISIGFGGFLILAWICSKYIPKMEFLSGLILKPSEAKTGREMEINITAPVESVVLSLKEGDTGEVISTLRPAGKVKFVDAVVDVVAEAEFISTGRKVKITQIHGNRVVAREVDK